jgi:hypothetical protein
MNDIANMPVIFQRRLRSDFSRQKNGAGRAKRKKNANILTRIDTEGEAGIEAH